MEVTRKDIDALRDSITRQERRIRALEGASALGRGWEPRETDLENLERITELMNEVRDLAEHRAHLLRENRALHDRLARLQVGDDSWVEEAVKGLKPKDVSAED